MKKVWKVVQYIGLAILLVGMVSEAETVLLPVGMMVAGGLMLYIGYKIEGMYADARI